MAQEKHHYLPAAYLGGFSFEDTSMYRDRRVYAMAKPDARVFSSKAGGVASVRGLYKSIDPTWSKFESHIPRMMTLLARHDPILAHTWLRHMVPFAASMLLRSPEFDGRHKRRLGDLDLESLAGAPMENVRLIELQRLLAPILSADWLICHFDTPTIAAVDVGWIPCCAPESGELAAAIPLTSRMVLVLVPRRGGPVLNWENGQWWFSPRHRAMGVGRDEDLNLCAARCSQQFVFAAKPEVLAPLTAAMSQPPHDSFEPIPFGPYLGKSASINQFTWHRLVCALEYAPEPSNDAVRFNIVPQVLGKDWCSALVIPLNLPEFLPAMVRVGNCIVVAQHRLIEFGPNGVHFDAISGDGAP